MNTVLHLWREPAVKVIVTLVLLSTAAGVVRGYAALGHAMVERHGSVDFGLFYASARQHLAGGSLYGTLVRPGSARPAESPNLNPPHVILFFLPFALLEPRPALVAWMILSLLALTDMLRIVVRESGWRPWTVGGLALLVYLLAWAPMAALVLTAQLGALVAWPVTRGWRAARRGDWRRAGWWFGVSAGLKLFLLLLFPFLAMRRRWEALARGLAAVCLLIVSGWLVFGAAAYGSWVHQFGDVSWHGHYLNASIWGLMARLFEGFRIYEPVVLNPGLVRPVWAALAIVVLVVTYRSLARVRGDADREVAIVLTTALLVSPLGWVYYFWLLVPPVALLVCRGWRSWGIPLYIAAGLVVVGTLWHASATAWLQPSALATLTLASPYFWALAIAWAVLASAAADTQPVGQSPASVSRAWGGGGMAPAAPAASPRE